MAPFMYATSITIAAGALGVAKSEVAYYGILGIALVLLVGLLAFLPVKARAAEK